MSILKFLAMLFKWFFSLYWKWFINIQRVICCLLFFVQWQYVIFQSFTQNILLVTNTKLGVCLLCSSNFDNIFRSMINYIERVLTQVQRYSRFCMKHNIEHANIKFWALIFIPISFILKSMIDIKVKH